MKMVNQVLKRRYGLRSLLVLLLLAAWLTVATPAQAAGLTCTVGASGANYTTIQAAVNDSGCTTINVAAGTYTENVTINRNVMINGATSGSTIVDGNNAGSVFYIPSGTVTLANLTIQHGTGFNWGDGRTVGGGIYNASTLAVSNSTISGNSTTDSGGGIYNAGTLTVSNSTISGNSTIGIGGGILNGSGRTLTVRNSTISDNRANYIGSGIFNFNNTTLTLANTILANSSASRDCVGVINATNSQNNLIEDASNACGLVNGVNGNVVGQDPKLAPLQVNAPGQTATHALLAGSPAIDAGDDAICSADPINGVDQRGIARPIGSHCDIGAFERAVNATPVATDHSYNMDEDTLLTISAPGLLADASDANGDPLTAVLVSNPTHGSLTLNADGSFSYTPTANFNGSDSFTYKTNDSVADSNVATVSLTVNAVNDAPVATDDSYATDEDTGLTLAAPGVLTNDSDADGNPLAAALVDGPSHGSVTLNTDGSLVYTPAANFNGADSFTYKGNDGSVDSNVATVSLTVNAVNDAPVAVADSYTINANTTLTTAAPGLLGNDSDVEGSPLTAAVVSPPAHGTVTLDANGSFSYTPAQNFSGTDSFTYQASDGADVSTVATVTITVNPVNPGVGTCGGYTVYQNGSSYIAAGWSGTIKVGTNGNNTLTGTNGPDLLLGLGGNDQLKGQGGDDLLCGGDGVDLVQGLAGNDHLDGGNGNDVLNGGSGDYDVLVGGEGNDALLDGDGVSNAQGGAGNDLFTLALRNGWRDASGQPHFASLTAGYGNDTVGLAILNNLPFLVDITGDERDDPSSPLEGNNDGLALAGVIDPASTPIKFEHVLVVAAEAATIPGEEAGAEHLTEPVGEESEAVQMQRLFLPLINR